MAKKSHDVWLSACRAAREDPHARQYTISAGARILGVDPSTGHRWAHAGRYPTIRLGPKSWFIKRDALRRFLIDSQLRTAGKMAAGGRR